MKYFYQIATEKKQEMIINYLDNEITISLIQWKEYIAITIKINEKIVIYNAKLWTEINLLNDRYNFMLYFKQTENLANPIELLDYNDLSNFNIILEEK